MKKLLVVIKLILVYWISALIADTVYSFGLLSFVPIIEREIIIKVIFSVLYVVLATITVAYDGVKNNKIGIAILSVQFIISSLMIVFGKDEIIYIISTPIAMGNYILYGNYSEYEPMKSLLYFILSLSLTFSPIIIGNIINSKLNKNKKQL